MIIEYLSGIVIRGVLVSAVVTSIALAGAVGITAGVTAKRLWSRTVKR